MSSSERLRENIRKYRTEERLLAVDPTSFRDESDACEGLMNGNSLTNLSVPQSPCTEMNTPMKLAEMSSVERRLKLQAEVCLCMSIYQILFDIQVKVFSSSSQTTNSFELSSREMTSGKQAQKFHNDDVSLPRSG